MAILKTQVNEIIWWIRAVGSAAILYLVTAVLKVVHYFKNNKKNHG
jgi:hypothetical protein